MTTSDQNPRPLAKPVLKERQELTDQLLGKLYMHTHDYNYKYADTSINNYDPSYGKFRPDKARSSYELDPGLYLDPRKAQSGPDPYRYPYLRPYCLAPDRQNQKIPGNRVDYIDPSLWYKTYLLAKGISSLMSKVPTVSDFLRWLQANGIDQQPEFSTPDNDAHWTPVPGIEPPRQIYFSSSTRTKLGLNLHTLEADLEASLTNPGAIDIYYFTISGYLTGKYQSPTVPWQKFITPSPTPSVGSDPRIGDQIPSEVVKAKALIFPHLINLAKSYRYWGGSNESVPPAGSKLTNSITGEKYLTVQIPGMISITWLEQLA